MAQGKSFSIRFTANEWRLLQELHNRALGGSADQALMTTVIKELMGFKPPKLFSEQDRQYIKEKLFFDRPKRDGTREGRAGPRSGPN